MTGARKRKDCDGGGAMRAAFMKALAVRVSDTRRRSSTITLPTGTATTAEIAQVLTALDRAGGDRR